ncbi:MAG: FecR domain-containing protein, partial [Polaromonas sp.]
MRTLTDPKVQQKTPVAPVIRALAAIFLIATCTLALAQAPAATPAVPRVIEPSLPYVVKASDKLIRLSRDLLASGHTWNDVASYNQLKDPNVIFPGQKIDIPLRFLKSTAAGGKVISAEGDVTLGGSPMQPGAAIGDGSQLKTGANSSAVIEMGDGSRIKILPNSLAEVVTNRSYAMRDASASGSTNWFSGLLRLSAGTLEALASKNIKRATPLQVETPTSLVGVRGTEFRVAFDDPAGNSARTEVVEGNVRTDNPAQQVGADLITGTGAVVKPAEREIRVVKLLPAPDMGGVPGEILKPAGSWPMPVLAGAQAYRVQVASDDKFDRIVRDLKVSTSSADLATLANGNWFARVRGIDAQGLEGFDTVKLIAVKDGEWRVSYSSMALVNGKALLSWTGLQTNAQPMPASGYTAVLARDQALTQVVSRAEGNEPMLDLGDLKPGVYFIRLRSKP